MSVIREIFSKHKLIAWLSVVLMITTVALFIYNIYIRSVFGASEYEPYERHYAFICGSPNDSVWDEIYTYAKESGDASKVYVDWFGKDMQIVYPKDELVKMAIDANVDGIILEGDNSDELKEAIDEAVDGGIPVVTVFTDSSTSKRQSYIGAGLLDLGREYAREIIKISTKDTKNAVVLTEFGETRGEEIYRSIRQTLSNEGNHLDIQVDMVAIDENTSSEQAANEILSDSDELPDIILCTSESTTIDVYQEVRDQNVSGEVFIIGYSTADSIVSAMRNGGIQATVKVDTNQIGTYAVRALDEYYESGIVSDFVNVNFWTVTVNNVEGRSDDED